MVLARTMAGLGQVSDQRGEVARGAPGWPRWRRQGVAVVRGGRARGRGASTAALAHSAERSAWQPRQALGLPSQWLSAGCGMRMRGRGGRGTM